MPDASALRTENEGILVCQVFTALAAAEVLLTIATAIVGQTVPNLPIAVFCYAQQGRSGGSAISLG